ncbi:MAG: hypothetical protein PHP54_06205 [Clostridia bacterium]|nr:hypothetical protein [Clostridia bacterium]
MKKESILKFSDERKDIVLELESKIQLNEVMNNQINTLIELQNKLNENDENIIDFNHVKETIFKTEYFLFKLKSTL